MKLNTIKSMLVGTGLSAASLGLLASVTSVNALAETVEQDVNVEIVAGEDANADVTIIKDGQKTQLQLPKEALHDQEQLKAAIADLPEETQATILEAMGGMRMIHADHDGKVIVVDKTKVKTLSDSEELEWVSEDGKHKKIMVIQGSDVGHHMVKNVDSESHVFVHSDEEGGHAKAIVMMLNKGKFTPEQLDQIQQALDAKR
ncbi:hypothetical protein E2K93_16660 [Thalassotalea sp. HSM 43]|uniref:hypothetical protein n=1 Tax=Thalassotalea sp. HSM 43 TaxID=2552945 RepID=UPI0010821A4C|nr:hypothetical protein [Thalassotalea sp. HSM 43]QBY05893.1 hypothetical protein E2K93_16660 [Thalassotalea sp. HSM 43]